jgi:diguanylate cyclase (GGDEF)-like protein
MKNDYQEGKDLELSKVTRIKAELIDQMASPVVMFGPDDVIELYNRAAENLLTIGDGMTLQEFTRGTNLRYILTPERRRLGRTREFHLAVHLSGKVYLIHGKERWGSDERYKGVFLVYNDITDQENMKNEATYYATHDKLTGLWNRDYFFEMVQKELSENPDEEFLMIATDINQFKLFNEILGTRAGNELLLTIAENFRKYRKEKWIFSRFTGDRFALFLPKSDFHEEKFLEECRKIVNSSTYSLNVHNYLGVYEVTERDLMPEQMYNHAYLALDSIKGMMNVEIAYYDDKIRTRRLAEHLTIDELDYALQNDEFIIYIQPQIDIENNRVIGGETLVRWMSPKRGLVMPSEFVPLFEKNGMISKLDYHVWEVSCRLLKRWEDEGHPERTLSINISAKNFYLMDLYEKIIGLVEKYRIAPQRLKLEITETAFVLDVKKQMELVQRLQEKGFLVEMDDFGSGYSSLNSLKDISIDILKLDIKFFEKSDNPERGEKIIKSMIGLARSLRMPVIAEGVEDEQQLELLRRVGCRIVQGFYYAKPLSVEQYEAFLDTHEHEDMWRFIQELKGREYDV